VEIISLFLEEIQDNTRNDSMNDQDVFSLWQRFGFPCKSHPWHGVDIGEEAPLIVTVYVEIVPTDTVKYELD
jgi:inorganic pyrophosphatase